MMNHLILFPKGSPIALKTHEKCTDDVHDAAPEVMAAVGCCAIALLNVRPKNGTTDGEGQAWIL